MDVVEKVNWAMVRIRAMSADSGRWLGGREMHLE